MKTYTIPAAAMDAIVAVLQQAAPEMRHGHVMTLQQAISQATPTPDEPVPAPEEV